MSGYRKGTLIVCFTAAILILAGRLYNYNLTYYNWTYLSNPMTSKTVFGFSNTDDCTQELTAIRHSATKWNTCGAAFAFPQIQEGAAGQFNGDNFNDGQNQIGWKAPLDPEYEEWPAYSVVHFDPDSNKILQVDTIFNDDLIWSTASTPPEGTFDVQSVMLHEFGHWLGLWHSASPAVMQPTLGPGKKRRQLEPDDIDGGKATYNYLGWGGSQITANAGWSISPSIAVEKDNDRTQPAEENNVHLVWADKTSGNYEIYYRKHKYGGNENILWIEEAQLCSTSGDSAHPALATDSKKYVHVVWQDNSSGNNEIYYARSVDRGDTWSAPVKLTENAGDSIAPAIAVDSLRNVHVVWMDNSPGVPISNPYNYEIYYRKSLDKGANWEPELRLTSKSGLPNMFALSGQPDIAADTANNIHVVWRDNRYWATENIEIFYKKWTKKVDQWSDDRRLTTSIGGGGCFEPAIAISESDKAIHIVYTCEVPENFNGDIFYLKSTDGGASFPYVSRITMNEGYSKSPDICLGYIDEGAGDKAKDEYFLHAVWEDDTPGEEEIYYARSQDKGDVWTASTRISQNNTDCYGVSVGAFGYNIHLAWSQKVGTETDHEIHHRRNRARI